MVRIVGTDCIAVRYDWWVIALQRCEYEMVGISYSPVRNDWSVPTVKLWVMIGAYRLRAVWYNWWVQAVQLCGMIGGY